MRVYREIRTLALELKSPKIRERRSAAEKLQNRLSLAEVRRRLSEEAAGSSTGFLARVRRRKILAELWRCIIVNAVMSAKSTSNSSSKLTVSDIVCPFKLLRCCDTPDDHTDTKDPFTRYEPSRLSRKEVEIVFTYCYEMLGNETALALAEPQLLDMLAYICSRKEYVAYLRPYPEMQKIMQEVEHRLLAHETRTDSSDVSLRAAKVFENIIRTTMELGVSINLLMAGCVKLASAWCSSQLLRERTRSISELTHLMRGLAILLQGEPVQAISPLTRHGKPILSFAKRLYNTADENQRSAIDDFFKAHLIVSQAAGKLQGLLTGDLGDLGTASLTAKQVTLILDLLLLHATKDEGNTHRLELAARFLACAQRSYFSSVDWDALSADPLQSMMSYADNETLLDDCLLIGRQRDRNNLSSSLFGNSPFANLLLRHLCTVSDCRQDPILFTSTDSEKNTSAVATKPPQSSTESVVDTKQMKVALLLLKSCIEVFPAGSCWIADLAGRWHIMKPDVSDIDSDYAEVLVCSGAELAVIVEALSFVLEWAGGSSGDEVVQLSAIKCLRACTVSTSLLVEIAHSSDEGYILLQSTWRRVWSLVFRPDLIYCACTKGATLNSVGDFVLQLLTDMIQRSCTDIGFKADEIMTTRRSNFVYSHQSDLWNLPVFARSSGIIAPYSIIYAVLSTTGLSEKGCLSAESIPILSSLKGATASLRSQLVNYCLLGLDLPYSHVVAVASACIGALLHGRASLLSEIVNFNIEGGWEGPDESICEGIHVDPLHLLWQLPSLHLPAYGLGGWNLNDDTHKRVSVEIRRLLSKRDSNASFNDLVSTDETRQLVELFWSHLEKRNQNEMSPEIGETPFDVFSRSIRLIKVALSVMLESPPSFAQAESVALSSHLTSLFCGVVAEIKLVCGDENAFVSIFGGICGVVRIMTRLASHCSVEWSNTVLEAASMLCDTCYALLDNMVSRDRDYDSASSQRVTTGDDIFNGFDDDHAIEQDRPMPLFRDSSKPPRKKQRRHNDTSTSFSCTIVDCPPNQSCCYFAASLLLALSPEPDANKLVGCTLAGIDRNDSESYADVDIYGGALASILLSSRESLLISSAMLNEHGSVDSSLISLETVNLICRIISAVRSAATPDSCLHMFGYEIYPRIVMICEDIFQGHHLDSISSQHLIDLIKAPVNKIERRSLVLRPVMRAAQLRSAILVFQSGKKQFHEQFDREFARSLVLPALSDISSLVRWYALIAVVSAVKMLPEEKVAQSVLRRLPSLVASLKDERMSYQEWFSEKLSVVSSGSTMLEKQAWDDIFCSIRYDTISCWAKIAQAATSRRIREQCVLHFIHLSNLRPDSEGLSFRGLQRIALFYGITMRALSEYYLGSIVSHSLINSESHLPLLLTTPGVVQRLLEFGHIGRSKFNYSEGAVAKIRETCRAKFISLNLPLFAPRILFYCTEAIFPSPDLANWKKTVSSDNVLTELFAALGEQCCVRGLTNVITENISEIQAHLAWRRTGSEKDNAVAVVAEKLVFEVLSQEEVQRHFAKLSWTRTVRVVIELSCTDGDDSSAERLLEAFHSLSAMYDKRSNGGAECRSLIDAIIHSRLMLVRCHQWGCRRTAWLPMDASLSLIITKLSDGSECASEISLFVLGVSHILFEVELKEYHLASVTALDKLGKSLVSYETGGFNVKNCMRTIVGLVSIVLKRNHAAHQDACRDMIINSKQVSRNIQGLTGAYRMSERLYFDGEPWPQRERRGPLDDILDHKTSMEEQIIDACSSLLEDISEKQRLSQIHQSANSCNEGGIHEILDRLEEICWRSSLRSEFNARLSAMDEHRVLDLLQHLNESVCHKGSIESPSAHHLVRVLMRLCTESFSRAIRAESSRCLGNLVDCEIEVETGSTHAEPKDSLRNAIEEGNVIHHLRSRCIVSLLDAVKSHHPWIASVAVDTLKVIVSKKITFDWNSLASSSDQKLLKLLDFTCSVNEGEQQTCRLTEREIAFMRSQSSSHDKDDWCWNATDWSNRSQSGKTFDEWICFIVPSIILSCYKSRPNQLELKSSMIFFQACERMSCINPNFAATLFPCLILDLLQRSSLAYDENVTAEDLLLDTWIGDPDSDENKNLSRCMASLLTDSLSTKSAADLDLRKTVKLTIHSIDILRQLTEHRFRTSPGHRRNNDIPMCLKRHLGGERRRPEQYLLTPDAVRDIELASTQQWDGLKYGTVLELDGLIIAKACVKACKSTAALLYAEMYAENRFGGSTAARDTIESLVYPDQLSSCPRSAAISGFWVRNRKSCLTYRESRDFLATLYMCFRLIEESDAQEAVRQELADLSVLLPENPELTDDRATKESRSHDRDGGVESSAQVLDGVCFSSALGSYVAYLASYDTEANYPSIRRLSGSELADSTVWNRSAAVAQDLCNPEDLRLRHHLCPADIEDLQSFQLYMTEAVVNLLDKNYLACGAHAKEARSVLLDTISLHLSSGTSSEAILIILDCFRSINFLESFLDQSSSLANLCRLFQPKTGDPTCGKHWGRSELSSCIKEVIARHLVTQVSNDCPKAQKLLLDIMWDTHSMYSSKGDLRSAGATLSRISTLVLDHSMKLGQVGESDCITRLSIEEARLLESRGNFTGAIRSLKQIIKRLRCMSIGKSQIDDNRIADVLLLCGNWMAGRKSEPAASILNSYLKPGAEIAQNLFRKDKSKINAVRLANALLSVSQVAFSIYDSVASRVKSFEWQNASKLLEERKRETEECTCLIQGMQAQRNTDKKRAGKLLAKEYEDLCIYRARLAKEIEQTEMERSKILASYRVNQSLVLESIADALSLTNTGGDAGMTKHVYRFVGVWFSALERNEYDRPVDAIICQTIEKVPSFHFVTLSSQIFSRVESVSLTLETAFQHTLHRLVNKLCFDHPYHCLVHLVNLLNGTNVGSGVNGRNASAFVENAGDARVKAGTEIATALKKHSGSYVSHLVANYQKLAHAYIHLAMTPTEPLLRGDTKRISFVSVVPKTEDRLDACLGGRRSLNADFNPCVLTCKPPIRPACDYGEGLDDPIGAERVLSFESFFALTDGGVHRPKIVVCIGSRGGKFRQLVKGEDEIRQDAVMQQVFGFVNEFLLQRVKTDQRKSEAQLGLYTYSIIPLSPASGVLEWVEHAVPFGDFIIDKGSQRSGLSVGSHSRYYPGEWGNNVCRELLKSAQNVNKRVVFDAICLHFSPSFRFFFMERFGYSADRWYAAKMRYTRSVAVNSVVGHILGIGDRHCSNILVHQETGEVVHIDFGIVFEQGRLLRIPETVPFRLTRNVVDGMGPLGTDGVFTRSAEATLHVLKENASGLLTILSAIACDPLYAWSLSPTKARQRQRDKDEDQNGDQVHRSSSGNAEDQNNAAARAIAKVNEKLQGYEDGTAGEQQSVEGQIQLLLTAARDPDNLCELFCGWAPWI